MFWSWGGATQQGVVGLSVFFSLLTFPFNCEPGFASSRFDSGVSILVAAFVRPDGWIQGRLVLQRPSRPVLDARTRDCTGPYLTAENIIARAVRHGSSFWSCNGREAMSPIWREVARVAGSLGYIVYWPFYKAVYAVCMDETTMLRMQFAARLHPLQRAPVELHDTCRGRRRRGGIQCKCVQSSDP